MVALSAAVAFLAASCASADGPAEPSSSAGQSAVAAGVANEALVERAEPLVKRVSYPTRGQADPAQNWGDLYLPAGQHAAGSVPLVVLIHGGSWESQLGAEVMSSYARDLVDRGMAVYNIEYRRVGSGGGWPTTFHDVADALDHVVELNEQHPEFAIDDELVVGHSAGAQLAMWAGTRHALGDDEVGNRPRFRPTRVVSLAGPLDMRYAATHGDSRIVTVLGGGPEQVPDRYRSVDPIQNIDPNVPVVAVHGTADTMVAPANSERYIAAVKQSGGIGGLMLAEGEDHVSVVSDDSPWYARILDVIAETSDKTVDDLRDTHSN
ncbi:alpha/beta fold hydrolase [Dietzia aerolata]|uniref:Alpha/beta hydrolase family protein n=1 Tax=Dietzia aerolata TaxID=595984 RepID=A0ABV5JSC9_9ACTN|nr:alpha/beta fold hydrolase [Dietzia aerolata]MBB0968263.1 alpha/beta fold hydrolase [Dietzia aerolata]